LAHHPEVQLESRTYALLPSSFHPLVTYSSLPKSAWILSRPGVQLALERIPHYSAWILSGKLRIADL